MSKYHDDKTAASDDEGVIAQRKSAIPQLEWHRTAEFASAAISRPDFTVRDGRPLHSGERGTRLLRG